LSYEHLGQFHRNIGRSLTQASEQIDHMGCYRPE
jgi:hypothetical protein